MGANIDKACLYLFQLDVVLAGWGALSTLIGHHICVVVAREAKVRIKLIDTA